MAVQNSGGKKKKKKAKSQPATLRGVEAWTKPKKKKKSSSKKKDISSILGTVMKEAVQNLKPVGGAVASELATTAVTKNNPALEGILNAGIYLAGGAFCALAPTKMKTVKTIVQGAVVSNGTELVKKGVQATGSEALNGYMRLGGYKKIAGYQRISNS